MVDSDRHCSVLDAHLHVEIQGVHVQGSIELGDAIRHDFTGWGELIGAVLAGAGRDVAPSLAPRFRPPGPGDAARTG